MGTSFLKPSRGGCLTVDMYRVCRFTEWKDAPHRLADALGPEYLSVNRRRVPGPTEPLWPGPWRWVVYTASRTSGIKRLLRRGFIPVDTDNIRRAMRELQEHR